jgi:Protein of unknown function DUF262
MGRSEYWTNPPDFEERCRMRTYESRTYTLTDLLQWDNSKQIELNPDFQRRAVWTDNAKSYLIDTILRGKPIPKLFVRNKINVSTKTTTRDVVDGQQRIRTILSYLRDGFSVFKRHNKDYGDLLFSQLPEAVQAQVLEYEITVDNLIAITNIEVLDVFSRLNSYAVILNEQEKINANHFSAFKLLADHIGHKYNTYWMQQGILTSKNIMRMLEVNLVADVLIAMIEGIKSKKQIKPSYDKYEQKFEENTKDLERKFDEVVSQIADLFPDGLADTEFKRPFLFYSLFTAVAHKLHGLPDSPSLPRTPFPSALQKIRSNLGRVNELFTVHVAEIPLLKKSEQQFLQDSRRATTDAKVRIRRTQFLLRLMS